MMATDELIRALRAWAIAFKSAGGQDQLVADLFAAADRLEELDERIAIMAADMDNEWGNGY